MIRGTLAVLLSLFVVGCDESTRPLPRPLRVEPEICLEACAKGLISELSSTDRETPSGDAIRAIHELCAAAADPCCRHGDGGARYYRASCARVAPALNGHELCEETE